MLNARGHSTGRFLALATLCVLALALLVFGGCSKKQAPPPETDSTAFEDADSVFDEMGTIEGEGETEPEPEATPLPDYASLEPAEFGVEDIFFAFDEYDLSSEAMTTLSQNARILRDDASGVTVLIEGHCDERGTIEYNLALGEKRALAVKDYLVSLGISSHRLRVTSYGESRPFATGSYESVWAQNRRAHFARP